MVKKKATDIYDKAKKYIESNPKKCIIISVFLVLALLGLILSRNVKINYNLSDYLGKDTETSIALEIMTDEFGMTGNVQVMLYDIEKDTANKVKETLSDIVGVLTVSFDSDSENSYKDGDALFTLLIDGEDHSDTAKYVIQQIKIQLGDKYGVVELGGSTIEYNALRENTGNEMGLIIVLSITMAALLLLVTASSWIEPLILLACSGIAIAINMGLNIFIGEISYITNSVSSILQLALSIDYSIIVLHTYRDEKKRTKDNTEAMRKAVKAVLNPVSASALTTMAGLLALLFMSFTIGFDIGIVLIKGIVVSAITALIFLPVVVLILDELIKKTEKRPFVPKGSFFSNFAFKANKIAAPLVLVFVIAGAVLQGFNSYGFTDSIGSNKNIEKIFGRNDSIVLVYKTGSEKGDYEKELLLREELLNYKNSDGQNPLTGYTSSSTTFKENYTIDRAVKVLGLSESDVKMLFAMYNIYENESVLTLTPNAFVRYAKILTNSGDPDISGLVDKQTKESITLLNSILEIISKDYNASALFTKLSSIKTDLSITDFAINQMYGLYFYDKIDENTKKISIKNFKTYIVDDKNYLKLPVSKDEQLKFAFAVKDIAEQEPQDQYFTYSEFCNKIIEKFPSNANSVTPELIQQTYIMYFLDTNVQVNGLPILQNKINGKDFVEFLEYAAKTNSVVSSQLDPSILESLSLACDTLSDEAPLSYSAMAEKMNSLQNSTTIDKEKISGVYIKYAVENSTDAVKKPILALDLVDFLSENMETNSLLKGKMTEEHYAKVEDAKEVIQAAKELFISDNYSRVLIGARLPAEGPEMVRFIDYLLDSVHNIFGNDAHITGKVVSTYDLQAAFDVDNLIITIFTIVSILLVILFIFKSISLPVILVLVIQGAVWISLSLCLISGGLVFFMSYIVTTCILMGATVDYGILMSNNYLVFRKTEDKSTSLAKAVDSAMPTVFTSGLILVVCGFVISLISSQNSIASVGTLLAQGTLVSIVMITLGLPSILFLLDKYILKLTMNDAQTAKLNSYIKKQVLRVLETKAGQKVVKFLIPLLEKADDLFGGKKRKEKLLAEQRKREIQEKRKKTIEAKKKAALEAIANGEPLPVTKKTPGRKPRKAPLTPEQAKEFIEKKAAEKEARSAAKKESSKISINGSSESSESDTDSN